MYVQKYKYEYERYFSLQIFNHQCFIYVLFQLLYSGSDRYGERLSGKNVELVVRLAFSCKNYKMFRKYK